MIVALILGRKGSTGFPGKNTYLVKGKPLAWYPIKTALAVDEIDKIYLSTDDDKLKDIANELGIEIIERPEYLATSAALGEDAYVHGYTEIKQRNKGKSINMLVLLFCNSATISVKSIKEGINLIKDNNELDSAVTVSKYNMWSPLRARRLNSKNTLDPFVPFEVFGDPNSLNCDRDSQGDVLYADMGCSIVKSYCLEEIEKGLLPQKWMGKNIAPIYQEAGCDVDYEWQIPQVEWWISKYWDVKL